MLSVTYEIARDRPVDAPVKIVESRGRIQYELCGGLFLPEGVAALNSAAEKLLAGGQWFQLWKGEIVSMASPEIRECDGRLHRGPLVDQTAGPLYW